ncbi:MAG: hypothetical protein OEZ38_10990 [Gammaproteobacteria bacterium]|nr:hypothetical protein [Gammaproteobacteria bacterium]
MLIRSFVLILFMVDVFSGDIVFAQTLKSPSNNPGYEFHEPGKVIDRYFKALDKESLTVLGHRLDKSMLVPVRVEYVYELNSTAPKIKVYSNIKQPVIVTGTTNCKLRGVSANLDNEGNIIETEAHVWSD